MSEQLNAVSEVPQDTLTVPSQGADVGDWGTKLNAALQKLLNWSKHYNTHQARIDNPHGVTAAQAGAVKNALDAPQIVAAAAAATDANGNPTPDTVAFPPANYPLGTIFIATSFPAAVDDGDMTFRRTGAAGSEVWTWIQGSFRASNANGDYVRWADGSQRCEQSDGTAQSTPNAWGSLFISSSFRTFTFPAAFNAVPKAAPAHRYDGTSLDVAFGVPQEITTTQAKFYSASGTNGGGVFPGYIATGTWK